MIDFASTSELPNRQPHNFSRVGQSVIYNGTCYLADRGSALIHVIDLGNRHHQTTIKGFCGKPPKQESTTTSTTTAAAAATSASSTSQLANTQSPPELRDILATVGPMA
uniref:Uncharacterized protein n=1 Tax=Talaromyces marneffei PM1 TaxID=1077442 RepID=A0A093Y5A9_TALMA